jgi:hypothetical protein
VFGAYFEDYFFHKIEGYNVVAQTMVDNKKRFMDVLCWIAWECE